LEGKAKTPAGKAE